MKFPSCRHVSHILYYFSFLAYHPFVKYVHTYVELSVEKNHCHYNSQLCSLFWRTFSACHCCSNIVINFCLKEFFTKENSISWFMRQDVSLETAF